VCGVTNVTDTFGELQSRVKALLLFHNDAHNHKITGILKQLKITRILKQLKITGLLKQLKITGILKQ
jgi:hypothetical protein